MKQQTEPMHPILAKFHEAKQNGFEWADDAINAFDEGYANKKIKFYNAKREMSGAVLYGFKWPSKKFKRWGNVYNELLKKRL